MPADPSRGIVRRLREDRVLLFAVTVFLLLAVIGAFIGPMRWDEGSFLHNAEVLVGDDTRLEDNRPIALSALIALLWLFTGESVVAARLLVVLFGLACILVLDRITDEEGGDGVVAAFAFAPLLVYWSFHTYSDVPALFFLLLGWWAYRERRPVLAGVALGVATTFRYVFGVFALAFAAAYVYERRDLVRYGVGGVVGSAPFFLHSLWRYGSVLAKPRLYVDRVGRWSGSGLFATPVDSASAGVSVLAGLVATIPFAWRQMDHVERAMLLLYPAFLLGYAGNAFTRYWLPIIPVLLLVTRRGCSRRVFAIAAASMLVASGLVVGGGFMEELRCEAPYEDAVRYVEANATGAVVTDRWAETMFHLDRPVHSPWTSYEVLIAEHNVTHALMQENLSYPVEKRFSNGCVTYTVYALK